jgi:hypothetical protein
MTQPISPAEATKALNYHGIFFKKRVLEELRGVDGLIIVGEEQGVNFGETRVLDLLVADIRSEPHILFPIECKRGWRSRKQWFFFKDCDPKFRLARNINRFCCYSVFRAGDDELPACSEGFELDMNKPPKEEQAHKANQEPVFRAGSQLASATLGLLASRLHKFRNADNTSKHAEVIVPILVTNVEMFFVEGGDWSAVDLATGNFNGQPEYRLVNHVVLKQPFPPPEGYNSDFREHPNCSPDMDARYQNQLFTESLHVVNTNGLLDFFAIKARDELRTAKMD